MRFSLQAKALVSRPLENCYSNLMHDNRKGLQSLILSLIGLNVNISNILISKAFAALKKEKKICATNYFAFLLIVNNKKQILHCEPWEYSLNFSYSLFKRHVHVHIATTSPYYTCFAVQVLKNQELYIKNCMGAVCFLLLFFSSILYFQKCLMESVCLISNVFRYRGLQLIFMSLCPALCSVCSRNISPVRRTFGI